jgi:fructose-1,6-bisphosphatase/inositol monophosphatase family enzyme
VATHRPADVLERFHGVADAVAQVLDRTTDWGGSGRRVGQYAVDLAADEVCVAPLLAAGFRVLSEESGLQGPGDAAVVVVDPLDGSTNASRGIPWFATALCLVDGDGPAVALVANHATGVRHTAIRGDGAWSHGEALRPSACRELSSAIVGMSGLPDRHYGWGQYRALGAAAPDLCLVASGVLDGYVDTSHDAHGVWDYLASVLVLTEAGAAVVDAHGRDLVVLDPSARRTPVAAATPELLDALVSARVRAAAPDRSPTRRDR